MKRLLLFLMPYMHSEDPRCVQLLMQAIQSPFTLTQVQSPTRMYPNNYYQPLTDKQGILKGCDFSYGASLKGKNLQGFDLEGASFEGADVSGTNFVSTKLYGTNFRNANAEHADFSSALSERTAIGYLDNNKNNTNNNISKTWHLFESRQINDHNLKEKNITFDGANLQHAKFVNSVMTDASFQRARLENSNFFLAQLHNSTFKHSFIDNAIFRGANFKNTHLFPLAHGDNTLDEKKQATLMYQGIMALPMIMCCTKLPDATSSKGFNVTSVLSNTCTINDINACIELYKEEYPDEFIKLQRINGDLIPNPSHLPSWFKIYTNQD